MKRSRVLEICHSCHGNSVRKGCIITDIEASDIEDIIPPQCVLDHIRQENV